jgi:porin
MAFGRDSALIGAVLSMPLVALAQQSDPPKSIWEQDNLTGDWGGLRTRLRDAGITIRLQEQSEVWANVAGGLRQGVVYDGLTSLALAVDLEKAVGWVGGRIFANGFQIHGRGPSANLVGNTQLVSSLEATRDTKLYQLWIQQTLFEDRLSIRLGRGGANDEFMITQYGATFLNSSFGFPGLPAADLPSGGPNYPLASPFVRIRYNLTESFRITGALFSGDPAPQGTGDPQLRDHGGLAFRLNAHVLAFGEMRHTINQEEDAKGLPGTFKLGAWYHSGHFSDELLATNGLSLANPASTDIPRAHSTDFAVYGIVDQMVWKTGSKKQGIGVFLEVMGAPDQINLSNIFVETGFNWKGPFPGRESDVAGIGIAYLGISSAKRSLGNDYVFFTGTGSPYAGNETVIEATYQFQIAPWWTMQPDLQVVINPGAGIPSSQSNKPLRNDVITGMRTTITF